MKIPPIGLGTWELWKEKCVEVVKLALELGYRHFDTAHNYDNHREIGKAIHGFPRDQLFLTSKFTIPQLDRVSVEETCDLALRELNIDYLDLYLLHFPDRNAPMRPILEVLEGLKATGKARHVGVSNCTARHLQDMLSWGIRPAANQVEFHPYLYQKELLEFCNKEKIRLISYRTLGKGTLVKEPFLKEMAEKYGKTPAQLLLRWCLDKGIPVIPKASSKEHLAANLAAEGFRLTPEDTATLDHLKKHRRYCNREWADFSYI